MLLLLEVHLVNTDIGQFQIFGYNLHHLGLITFPTPTSLCGTSPKSEDLDLNLIWKMLRSFRPNLKPNPRGLKVHLMGSQS